MDQAISEWRGDGNGDALDRKTGRYMADEVALGNLADERQKEVALRDRRAGQKKQPAAARNQIVVQRAPNTAGVGCGAIL
jgi:hypothetical protein